MTTVYDSSMLMAAGAAPFSPADTSPQWWMVPTSAQTGSSQTGAATWQAGSTSGSAGDDPSFSASPDRWVFGAGDIVEILHPTPTVQPAPGTNTPLTICLAVKAAANPAAATSIWSARSGSTTGPGTRILWGTTGQITSSVSDGTTVASAPTTGAALNTWQVIFLVCTASNIYTRVNGTTTSTTARPGGSQNPTLTGTRIGRLLANYNAVGSPNFPCDVRAALAWDRELTAQEMTDIEAYFGAGT